jgi:hypothetical protein
MSNNAKQATIKRFTNLFDGGILPRTSVSQIIEYYEAQLRNVPITVKQNCSITNKFKEAEIDELTEGDYWDVDKSHINYL